MSTKRSFAIGAIAIFLALGITGGIFLFRPSVRARGLLGEVSVLEVGKSTFDDAQRLAMRIKATPSNPCSPTSCTWYVRVDNSIMPRQWRGAGATFSSQFEVKDSIVFERAFFYQVGTGPNISFAEVEEQVHWKGNTIEPVFVNKETSNDDPYYRAFVRLTPAAPLEIRKRYLSFNFNCLWQYGGCQNARDLLPTFDWN